MYRTNLYIFTFILFLFTGCATIPEKSGVDSGSSTSTDASSLYSSQDELEYYFNKETKPTPSEEKSNQAVKETRIRPTLSVPTSKPDEVKKTVPTTRSKGGATSTPEFKRDKKSTSGGVINKFPDTAKKEVESVLAETVTPGFKSELRTLNERRASTPKSSGIKAGWNDDNKQFNYYLNFLNKYKDVPALPLDVSGRIIFTVRDKNQKPIPNCTLSFRDKQGDLIATRKTYADGRALFFYTETTNRLQERIQVDAVYQNTRTPHFFYPGSKSTVNLDFTDLVRGTFTVIPIDIAFLVDTTGSMGDEIAQLKSAIELINLQVTQISGSPSVQFAAVLYRDKGDEYVTKVIPFQLEVAAFRHQFNTVQAEGGWDTPEDLQSGLKDAIQTLTWRDEGVRLMFVVGDAAPHLDYNQEYTYLKAINEAAEKGVKISCIGASGLDITGEYVFRQIAQYTMGHFIFLTYGETGESEGGTSTSVSHHTGTNYETKSLESIIIRLIKTELANLTDQPVEEEQDYFETVTTGEVNKDKVLTELFKKSIQQLIDFAIVKINVNTPTAVAPVSVTDEGIKPYAERLEDKLILHLAKFTEFRILERANLHQLVSELKLSAAGLFDSDQSVELGKMVGAQVMVISKLYRPEGKDKLEMYLKLVKVETGEVLSATLLKIDVTLF